MRPDTPAGSALTGFLKKLGPGVITGASDDDPSGIATYSQVGAQFGYGMLWSVLFSFPLMAAVQQISARIGRVTGVGIAAVMRRLYPPWIVSLIVGLTVIANIVNIGADIAAIGAGVSLLIGGPVLLYAALLTVLSLLLQTFIPYNRYVHVLKWLTLALFAYVGTVFVVNIPWATALRNTAIPSLLFTRQDFTALIAVLGTTISPYLLFWQASQEVEEVHITKGEDPLKNAPAQAREQMRRIKVDTFAGMAVSSITAYSIILATAATLHASGITHVASAAQAAEALRPIAGRLAFLLFSVGLIGTGLLALPILAGSAAYAVGEALGWPTGLQRKPHRARAFYSVIAVATLTGLGLNLLGVDPIEALFLAAVVNGVVAGPVLVLLVAVARSAKVMGRFRLSLPLALTGWFAAAVMAAAAVGLFAAL